MPAPNLKSRRVLLPAVGLLCILALLPQRFCAYGPPLHGVALSVLGPLSGPLVSLSSRMSRDPDLPEIEADQLDEMRRELLHQDAIIRGMQRRIHQLRGINAELQGLREQLGDSYLLRHVSVIGHSSDGSGAMLQVDQGSRQGIRTGMPAVNGAHLIGRIVSVAPTSSTLEPITARGTLLEVVLTPPGLATSGEPWQPQRTALLEAEGPRLFTSEVDRELPVEVGDYARLADEIGPTGWSQAVQGRIVGRVVRVEPLPDDTLRKRIAVRPMLAPRFVDQATIIMPRGQAAPADARPPQGVPQP